MRWLALALLGVVVAAAVAIAASRLVSQQIGLASEPISAGDALAPATTKRPSARSPKHQSAKHPQATAPSAPSPETYEPAPEYVEPAPVPAPAPAPSESRPSGGGHDHGGGGEGADD
jgi:hypothetical protein